MKIKNEEYAQRFLPLPNGHTLPKCKVIKTFLNWLNEIAVKNRKKILPILCADSGKFIKFVPSDISAKALLNANKQTNR